jgi:hypothetical protein
LPLEKGYGGYLDMQDGRRGAVRFNSLAQVALSGSIKVSGNVHDISVTGCRTEFDQSLNVKPEETYGLRIYPEKSSGINPFGLLGKVVWVKSEENHCVIGFFLIKSSEPSEFQNYLDFIVYTNAAKHGIEHRLE